MSTDLSDKELRYEVVGACMDVHRALGNHLLEKVYKLVLAYELRSRGLQVNTEDPIAIKYKDLYIPDGLRADIVVENRIIIELKAVQNGIQREHIRQLQTYMDLTDISMGVLVNFGAERLMSGGFVNLPIAPPFSVV